MLFMPRTAVALQGDPCHDPQTQSELNGCEFEHLKKADADLNQAYKQLLAKYRSDTEFVKRLKLAQRAWLNFRDADMDSFYYQKDKLGAYGSVYPMCRAINMTQLTVERTKELRYMLEYNEGDVCGFQAAEASSNAKPQRVCPGSRGR